MRVLAGEVLDRQRGAAVGVAFAQHRVHGAAQALRVAGADLLLVVVGRLFRVVRHRVALALQFLDGSHELLHRGADVGQLDDVGVGQQRQLAELCEVVRHLLVVGQELRELAQDAGRDGDVAFGDFDACGRREGADDGQEGPRRQQRGFVRQGVDDGGLLGAHRRDSRVKTGRMAHFRESGGSARNLPLSPELVTERYGRPSRPCGRPGRPLRAAC